MEALLAAQRCEAIHEKRITIPILELHILPVFGELRIDESRPTARREIHPDKVESGLSAKTVRNLLLVLQGIMSLALDNDLIESFADSE